MAIQGTQDWTSQRMKGTNTYSGKKGSGSAEGGFQNPAPSTGLKGLKPVKTAGKYSHDVYKGKTFHNMSKGGNTAAKAQALYGPTGQKFGDGPATGNPGSYKKGYDI